MSANLIDRGVETRRFMMSGWWPIRCCARAVFVLMIVAITLAGTSQAFAQEAPAKASKKKPAKDAPTSVDRERMKLIGGASDTEKTGKPASTKPGSKGARPVITCDNSTHDLGPIWVGPILNHTFTIRNDGDETLEIRKVKPSCGCTIAGSYTSKIAPGESGEFPFAVKSTRLRGKFDKAISIMSNDPVTPVFRLRLRGEVKQYVELIPPNVYFSKLVNDEPTTKVITLTNNTENPLELELASPLKGNFDVELVPKTPGQMYELHVTAKPPLPPGVFRRTVTLKTNIDAQKQIRVDVRGSVPERLDVYPTVLTFRSSKRGVKEADIGLTRTIRFTNYGPKPVKVVDATVNDPAVTAKIIEQKEGKVYSVQVDFPPSYKVPADGRTVTLKTDDDKRSTIRIPIRDVEKRDKSRTAQSKPKIQRPAEELIGKAVPAFELTTVEGKKVSNDTLAGTITVLDFVSNRCGHCSKQIPRVEKIRQTYQDKGIRFITVGSGGTEEQVKDKIKQLGFKGELAIDSDRGASTAFKVRGVPSMTILGKTGKVEAVNVGNVGDLEKRMKGQLDALLTGKPVPAFTATTAHKPPPKRPADRGATPKRPAEELVGKPVPKFEITTVDGEKLSNESLAGSVTVLDFVSNRCGHCSKQLPRVEKIRQEYQDKGVRFITVGSGGTEEQVKDKIKQLGFKGDLAIDSDRGASTAFKVRGVPSMAILGKTGKVEAVNIGNVGDLEKRMKGQLDAMLAGKPVPTIAAAAMKPQSDRAPRRERPAEGLVGKAVPTFELTTVEGKKVSNDTLAGTITVLDFVSNRCGHCSKQIPRVEKIRQTYQDKGVRFITVGSGGTEEQVKDKIKQLGFKGDLAIDSDRGASTAFKVRGVPSMAILGKTGKVEAVNVGNVGDLEKRMKGQLDALLTGKPVPAFTATAAPSPKQRQRPATELVGKPAPQFSIKMANENMLSNDDFPNHAATVLNFVAPNCGYSKKQIPKVEAVRAEYEAKGVRFVNVNQTFRKSYTQTEAIQAYKDIGSNLELAHDGANVVGKAFQATGFPTLVVIDRKGNVSHVNIGARPDIDTTLKKQLDELIKAKP